jgi:hypothetical protein
MVQVESWSDVTTQGDAAHAISARSDTTGFPESVTQELQAALDDIDAIEAQIDFSVVSAGGSAAGVGKRLSGTLIDEDGEPVAGAGGQFEIEADGSFVFSRRSDFNDLEVGESRFTSVAYEVLGDSPITGESLQTSGLLVVKVTRTESGLEEMPESYFDEYGVSEKPQTEASALPDLQRYIEGLLADTEAGGLGNSVRITSDGTLETSGDEAHGIFASSQGGQGGRGRNSQCGPRRRG